MTNIWKRTRNEENMKRKQDEAQEGSEAAARTAADAYPEAEVDVDGVEAENNRK